MANENNNVVVDQAQSHWSDLWKKEDYWAIWLGFALLIAAICIFINGAPASYKETIDKSNAIMQAEAEKAPFKTIAYIQAQDAKKGIVGTNLPIAKEIKAFIASPGKWTDNPMKAMFTSQAEADAKNAANKEKAEAAKAKAESSFAAAQAAEKLAADAGYKDASLNTAAEAAIKDWTKAKADASKASAKAKPVNLFTTLPLLMVAFGLFFGIGIFVMGQNLPKFLIGFVGLFVVVVIAMILGKQSTMAYYGIGVEPWGIMFGMIIASGVRALSKVNFEGNYNLMLVAISIGVSMITLTVPNFFHAFPSWSQIVLHSGITLGSITAVVLNLIFNGLSKKEKTEDTDNA